MVSWLDDYENVSERIAKFWTDHPSGSIKTEVVERDADFVIFRAIVTTNEAEYPVTGTSILGGRSTMGYARRTLREDRGFEKCETAAIGRALANMGYAAKSDSVTGLSTKPGPATSAKPNDPTESPSAGGGRTLADNTPAPASKCKAIRDLLTKLDVPAQSWRERVCQLAGRDVEKLEDLSYAEAQSVFRQLCRDVNK